MCVPRGGACADRIAAGPVRYPAVPSSAQHPGRKIGPPALAYVPTPTPCSCVPRETNAPSQPSTRQARNGHVHRGARWAPRLDAPEPHRTQCFSPPQAGASDESGVPRAGHRSGGARPDLRSVAARFHVEQTGGRSRIGPPRSRRPPRGGWYRSTRNPARSSHGWREITAHREHPHSEAGRTPAPMAKPGSPAQGPPRPIYDFNSGSPHIAPGPRSATPAATDDRAARTRQPRPAHIRAEHHH